MSNAALKVLAGAGATGDPVYVDDLFSTFLYKGNGAGQTIVNGIALGDSPENGTFLQITGDGSIADVSPFGQTLTSSATITTSSSVKKFGSGSVHFAYDASTYPTITAPVQDFNNVNTAPQGTEDFTIEGWIYHSDVSQSYRAIYSTGLQIQIYIHSSNIIVYLSSSTSASYFVNGSGGPANSLSDNTWAHFALVRNGNTFTVYVNGVGGSSVTATNGIAEPSRSLIGGYTTTQFGLVSGSGENAYLDDFRITRGRAVYTANFTPPSAALPLDTQVTGEGGLVWMKSRTHAGNYNLVDTERGKAYTLESDGSGAQGYSDTQFAFRKDGFTINNVSAWDINQNNQDYVSWTWRKQEKFFDIVEYAGQNGHTQSHNLGSVPGMIIVKDKSLNSWVVWHRSVSNGYFYLDRSDAASTGFQPISSVTSTSFTLADWSPVSNNGRNYVAYVFGHDEQVFGENSDEAIIKCDIYTGNGSSTGPTVDLGFEPQWLLVKAATASSQYWGIYDVMRGMTTAGNTAYLTPNHADTEYSNQGWIDITPTGFQITNSDSFVNENGDTYIYVAIRRPHKPAEEFAATELLGIDNNTGQTGINTGNFNDFGFAGKRTTSDKWYVGSRLTQGNYLNFTNTNAESSSYVWNWDQMEGFFSKPGSWNGYIGYGFRRAPGFFDVVTYTGNQTARQIPHNLGVVPELMIVKCRSQVRSWAVYAGSQGNTKVNPLDSNAFSADTSSWNNTSPTSTHFTVGDGATTNFNPEPMVAYLFASVPGISKIGSYTATGSNINVDCGFTNGARFVVIKWANDVSNWYLWDSVRGIVAGTDPYLRLDTTNNEVTTSDWIDPLSSGFTVTNAAGNDVNNSGGTYIFLAIA
jgi:hypothetical protein